MCQAAGLDKKMPAAVEWALLSVVLRAVCGTVRNIKKCKKKGEKKKFFADVLAAGGVRVSVLLRLWSPQTICTCDNKLKGGETLCFWLTYRVTPEA